MKVFVAIPLLREFDNISLLVNNLLRQDYKNYIALFCINNSLECYNDDTNIEVIQNNLKTLDFLNNINNQRFIVIDKATKRNAFPQKYSGVGWARKIMMDNIVSKADDDDIIVSLDGDTGFSEKYLSSVVENFKNHKNITALCVPYYHPLTGNFQQDQCILRYELYMRHYMINMLKIKNPYSFTALGSAMAFRVKSYKKVKGIVPRKSGEDFYLMQSFSKIGNILLWNDETVYPQGRFSDRVAFGTGPAMIKGINGDWTSYPFYNEQFFKEIEETFTSFPRLYENDIELPMTSFLKNIFKTDDLWSPLRKNYKTIEQFAHACVVKVDALRILQYLRFRTQNLTCPDIYKPYQYKEIRDDLYDVEGKYREQHDLELE